MKIGIDIDEVVVNFMEGYLKFHNKKYQTNYDINHLSKYHLWECGIHTCKEDSVKDVLEFQKLKEFENISLVSGAEDSIQRLSETNEIFFITSRSEDIKEKTENFLKSTFSEINYILIFSGEIYRGKTKSEICKENKIEILVEDNPDYSFECAEKGIKIFLLDKPWNKTCPEHKNISRVKNWEEILEKIKEIEMEKLNPEKPFVEAIRKFVEECFNLPNAKYKESYKMHFIPVANYSKELAKKKNADVEVVEIAALLHDIGSVLVGRENHHLLGAEIAEKKLREINYPNEKIELVKKCILNHRGSRETENERTFVEEDILVEADALSAFDNLDGIFQAAFVWENLTQNEARISVREKLIRKYKQLSLEGKELIKPKYDAAMLLLN